MGTTARQNHDRTQMALNWLAVLACVAVSVPVHAATWRVERDGSGDFTTIQPAADASAPGDTILLGPGHYTEYTTHSAGEKIELNYYIRLLHNEITIIGVDADLVTVGPPITTGFDPKAVGVVNNDLTGSLTIERITFAHCYGGIGTAEENVTIRDCVFRENYLGVQSSATGSLLIEDCEFIENSSSGVQQYDAAATPLLIVRNCQFTDNTYGIDSQEENNLVENCTFTSNTAAAVQYSARAAGVIRSCSFLDNQLAVRLSSQTVGHLIDNQIWGGAGSLGLSNGSTATGTGNVFGGGTIATMDFTGQSTASMSGNLILLGTSSKRILVRSFSGGGHTIDLRNNYWGTSSAQEIADSITDSQDDSNVTGTVLFEPFLEDPVSAQPRSFGELKRLFFGGD